MTHLPLARSIISAAEQQAVSRVLKRGRLARGPEIAAFEAEFAAAHGVPYACSFSSGTAGIAAVLIALGIGAGDEVILPALTFAATANAVITCGATPVLADVDPQTWNLDPVDVRRRLTSRTKAVLVVHLFGLTADLSAIEDAAGNLPVIEDACEALGSVCAGGTMAGSAGTAGVFGFYPNKVVTTGEGGMIITRDEALHERCAAYANQGRNEAGNFIINGHSLRMTELGAAIGRIQLASLQRRLEDRAGIARLYKNGLQGSRLGLPDGDVNARSWFTFPVLLPKGLGRSAVVERMAEMDIETAAHFPALHQLGPAFASIKPEPSTPVSAALGERLLCLPFWEGMDKEHVARVIHALETSIRSPGQVRTIG